MEDKIFQQQADKKELDAKYVSYNNASKQNQELNDEHKKILSKFYEHIALYSAGAITFSTTMLGFVLPNNSTALATINFYLPNIIFLYISWLGFGIAFVTAILYKRFDAYYLSAFGFTNYTKRYREYLETELSFIEKYKGKFMFTGGTEQGVMGVDQNNANKLSKAHRTNKKTMDLNFKLMQWCVNLALVGAGVGVVALIFFSFLLTQTIVFS